MVFKSQNIVITVYLVIDMKILHLFFLIIPLITISFNLYAQEMAVSMGRLTAVASDGPFDAQRNPAILTIQKDTNSLGIMFSSDVYYSGVSHLSADFQFDNSPVDIMFRHDFSRVYSINGGLAYARKITDDLFAGISVFAESERSRNYMRSSMILGLYSRYESSDEKEDVSNTLCSLSVGYKISSLLSIGLQVQGDYDYKLVKAKRRIYSGLDRESNRGSKVCTQTATPMIGVGITARTGIHEAGLIATSGKYSWQKIEYYNNAQYFVSGPGMPVDYDIREKKEKKGKYIESPSFIAGYLVKLTSFLVLAVEAGISLPFKHTEHNLIANEDWGYYLDQEISNKMKFRYMINGGLEVNPVNDFRIAAGAGYRLLSKNKYEASAVDSGNGSVNIKLEDRDEELRAYFGTLGIENSVLSNSRIAFHLDAVIIKVDSRGGSSEQSMDANMKMDLKGFQLNSGISYIQNF